MPSWSCSTSPGGSGRSVRRSGQLLSPSAVAYSRAGWGGRRNRRWMNPRPSGRVRSQSGPALNLFNSPTLTETTMVIGETPPRCGSSQPGANGLREWQITQTTIYSSNRVTYEVIRQCERQLDGVKPALRSGLPTRHQRDWIGVSSVGKARSQVGIATARRDGDSRTGQRLCRSTSRTTWSVPGTGRLPTYLRQRCAGRDHDAGSSRPSPPFLPGSR